jgi:hypothetical protein
MAIMDELHMVCELLPQAPPPTREVTAAARARLFSGEASVPRSERSARGHRRPHWRWYGLSLPLVAAAAAVAVLLATSGQPASTGHPAVGGPKSSPATGNANVPSARAVLLAAATSAAKRAPAAMGKYWRVATTSMDILVAGSKAHPYDMAEMSREDNASARVAGQPLKWVSQYLGATPATSRDAAAWRADGSPTHGRDRVVAPAGRYKGKVIFLQRFAPSAPAVFQVPNQDGAVVEAVGDGTPLTTKQLAAFPSDPDKLKALMIRYVNYDYRGAGGVGTPTAGSMDENLMTEAINLLQAPLPPPVESAVYRVMAGLPGSKTLGLMRDPLGRNGYAIAYTSENSLPQGMRGQLPRGMQGQSVLFVDPSSGKLLATEVIVTTPGTGIVRYNPCNGGNPAAPGCIQPFSYGTRHQGQVWSYTVIKVAAWTNTLPPS